MVKPRVRYHCHDSRAIRMVFSTFCTGGLDLKSSNFWLNSSLKSVVESQIWSVDWLTAPSQFSVEVLIA